MQEYLVNGALVIVVALISSVTVGFILQPDATGGSFVGSFNSAITNKSVSVTSDAQVLATSTARGYASFCNDSGSTAVYLSMDGDTPFSGTPGEGIKLEGGECYEITDRNVYTGAVRATSTNSATLLISEYQF